MFVSVLGRLRAILKDGCHHYSCLAKLLQKGNFSQATPIVMPAGVCVTWLHFRGNDSE